MHMRFPDLLDPGVISIAPPWRTFDDTIDGMLAMLAAVGALRGADSVSARAALVEREKHSSTAVLDIGVGVPHARLTGLAEPLVALAVATDGLYEAAPTVPIRIVALVLSPAQTTDAHLHLLAGIATALRSPTLRDALLQAPDAAAALATLDAFL